MNIPTWLLLILLAYSSLCTECPVFVECKTVEQGLADLNERFPEWSEHYEVDEFDCSEMSALTNQYFKCAGFKSAVFVGGIPSSSLTSNDGSSHAWVKIDNQYIEATTLTIEDESKYARYKWPTEQLYFYISECDWWNSPYIKEQMEIPDEEVEVILLTLSK